MGRPNKKSRLIAGRRTDAGTLGGCKGTNGKHPGAENEWSCLKYYSDDSDNTSKSKNHDGIDMLLEEMGEKRFAAMVKTNKNNFRSV